jgi:hypothetical protein
MILTDSFRKITLILFYLLIIILNVDAQYILKGKVEDENGAALSNVTVIARTKGDSAIKKTVMTDSIGTFSISVASIKSAVLSIEALGYLSQEIDIYDSTWNKPIAVLLKHTTKQLAEVVVKEKHVILEHKIDRTVFNVDESIAGIGSDALEMLKNIPGVRVTKDDIVIIGKSSVNVMLNNRLVSLTGNELLSMLRSIPSGTLSKIEVITSPPAKYDAQGNSGLINIITKKSTRNGFNATLAGSYEQRRNGSALSNFNFNYKKNNLTVYGNGNLQRTQTRPTEESTSFYPDQQLQQKNQFKITDPYMRCQIGADYRLSKRTIFGLLYTYGKGAPVYDNTNVASVFNKTNILDSVIKTIGHSSDGGGRSVYNLNLEHTLDTTGKKINIDVDYFTRHFDRDRIFYSTSFTKDYTVLDNATNQTLGKQRNVVAATRIDVSWPTKIIELSFGAKYAYIRNKNDLVYKYYDGTEFLIDSTKTNSFDYSEKTGALYFTAKKKFGKVEIETGVRSEYTKTTGLSPTLSQKNINNYLKIFPSVFIQYVKSEDQIFNLTFTTRIDRPNFSLLNPFRSYTTLTSYSEGNPFLKPSFAKNIDLKFIYKQNFSFGYYVHIVDNYFTNVSLVDTLNTSIYFKEANVGRLIENGITANASFSPRKWWEMNTTVYAFSSAFRSNYYAKNAVNSYVKPTFSIDFINNFSFNKNKSLLAEIDFFYQHNQQSDFDLQSSYYNLTIGIKKMLLNNNLIIGFSGMDLLATDRLKLVNQYNGTRQNDYYDQRRVRFSVSYKIGNKKINAKRSRTIGVEEETKRAQ